MSELVLVANAGDGTISTLRLDGGTLTPLTTSTSGPGCGTFAVDPARNLVWAGHKAGGDLGTGITVLSLDRGTGALTPTGAERDVEASMTYLSLSEDGRFLLGASYGGGVGLVWPVAEDGALGEPVARIEHANLHCVVIDGDVASFVSLGEDLVAQYRLGPDGALTDLGTVELPEGCGPRHLVLDGEQAYLVTEFTGEVFHCTRDLDGRLVVQESVSVVDPDAGLAVSRMGADPMAEGLIWGADVHRAGDVVLASERHASTLASVAVDEDGHLGDVLSMIQVPTQPRGFNISADGTRAVVVGEKSTEAALVRVGDDGTLTQVATAEVGHGANWVRLVFED